MICKPPPIPPPLSVNTAQLVDGSVTNIKIANGAVDGNKLAVGAVGSVNIGSGAVDNNAIQTDIRKDLNLLANPGFNIVQLFDPSAPFVPGDNAVGFDCWKTTYEAADISISRVSNSGDPWPTANRGRFTKATAPGKVMIYQAVENLVTRGLYNNDVTVNAIIGNNANRILRLALIKYTGSIDTPIPSPVSAWNADTVLPTLNAGFSYLFQFAVNQPAGFGFWALSFGDIPTDADHLIVALISDSQLPIGGSIDLSGCKLNMGPTAPFSWNPLPEAEDIARCERFIEKSYDLDVPPASLTNIGQISAIQNGGSSIQNIRYRQSKLRSSVAPVFYSPVTGLTGFWYDSTGAADVAALSVGAGAGGVNAQLAGGTDGNQVDGHFVTDSSL